MITNKELNEVNLSPTKKDYYQIWNELLELADKISERWSPAATNESDPGIVLLKALTAIADKLNYNIDKNTLEAFMPSASQEESMRKLTEMMGYSMKYYQSATCKATLTYKDSNEKDIKEFGSGILFPKFTNIKNSDDDINYVTLEDITLYEGAASRDVDIIEGELIECESSNDNIISMIHLDDLHRYMLPETAIAENGIFVTNIYNQSESKEWLKEDNLNILLPGTKAYKFGFDSRQQLPYVQFPDDISELIEEGLRIKYIRTNGVNGNVTANTLQKIEKPALWSTSDDESISGLSVDSFSVTNASAATNGVDPESLNAAYNNYKKTIGTFDTLVTCRDYMNKIYQMTESSTNTTPLVSNIIVSDIRDDINRSTPLCSFNDYGIYYTNVALKEEITETVTITGTDDKTHTGTRTSLTDKIDHFDLLLYPFKNITGLNNKKEYVNSFKYSAKNNYKIHADLQKNKNIAHRLAAPASDDVACIKNYLRLKAKITTTRKVTVLEQQDILNNIYKAIYMNFNARRLDFGEEIPYESIVEVIKKADYRIKDLSMDEPALYTKFCMCDENGTEYELVAQTEYKAEQLAANRIYNNLAIRNILAGKIAAFAYNTDFNTAFDKTVYPDNKYLHYYDKITKLESKFDLQTAWENKEDDDVEGLTLKDNQVIQFRLPNLKTITTYPAYVNYFLKRNNTSTDTPGIPATMISLLNYMSESDRWTTFVNTNAVSGTANNKMVEVNAAHFNKYGLTDRTAEDAAEKFSDILSNYDVVYFTKDGENNYVKATTYSATATYYYLPITDNVFAAFNAWIKQQHVNDDNSLDTLKGIYKSVGVKNTSAGRLVDIDLIQYMETYKFNSYSSNKSCLENTFVQKTYDPNSPEVKENLVTADGLGQSANYATVTKDCEYQLKDGEYLLINYTDSKTDESTGTERKNIINKYYGKGTIIRPNFGIVDSLLYHNNHSYSKKDSFAFNEVPNPEGMFTLGANEQIEIRDIVKVELDAANSCLYWCLNSDTPHIFEFTEKYSYKDDNNAIVVPTENNAYTLKEGEYLFYTTSQKQNLAYYGAGSVIVKSANTTSLERNSDDEASLEDIMSNGLAADIPWTVVDLTDSATKKQKIRVIENQYVSLTAGDVIKTITAGTATNGIIGLDNNWVAVTGATYRFAEDSADAVLPSVSIADITWEARSRLDFNMNRTVDQVLNVGDEIKIYPKGQTAVPLTSSIIGGVVVPMHINSNYACQAALDKVEISVEDFKIKLSKEAPVTTTDGKTVSLNNYINGNTFYTKVSLDNTNPNITLNTTIPVKNFGLMMIYYTEPTDVTVEVSAKNSSNTAVEGIRLFNSGDEFSSSVNISAGINILEVTRKSIDDGDDTDINVASLTIEAKNPGSNTATVIFGNLDIVKSINPKLDYRLTKTTTTINDTSGLSETTFAYANNVLCQLLEDIKNTKVAGDFYYNVPIQGTSDIDLNPYIDDDKLSSPSAWYDSNNVNNKFVISEIDADYLSTGITFTKASRA